MEIKKAIKRTLSWCGNSSFLILRKFLPYILMPRANFFASSALIKFVTLSMCSSFLFIASIAWFTLYPHLCSLNRNRSGLCKKKNNTLVRLYSSHVSEQCDEASLTNSFTSHTKALHQIHLKTLHEKYQTFDVFSSLLTKFLSQSKMSAILQMVP